jgi:hypothetical protein
VHHRIGHRGSFHQVRVFQPKPYPEITVTTSPPSYTTSGDTIRKRNLRCKRRDFAPRSREQRENRRKLQQQTGWESVDA